MPVVQVIIAPDIVREAAAKAAEVGSIIEQQLVRLLGASPLKVQISMVAAIAVPKGYPISVVVNHRASDERTKADRDDLAHQIASRLHDLLDVPIRVRVIAIDPMQIAASDIGEVKW
ncbi:hypothetical protein [Rhizobium sp. NRK18]|uniref:hypothetical protein n=1 Tax=Rhizobium sp. NRK18 TaxID=2964667 RepID=UPI0021C4A1BB|nr:hypothetical protein [Rhizobium sp. NRK18]MCQ2006321.1 hypothetical protein [Rhizobium sp. NRK18]